MGGWGGFSKKGRKFYRPFFSSTKLVFWALPNLYKDPIFTKFSAPQVSFEKTGQKRRFRHFLENINQKIAFFGARSPLKFSMVGAKGIFRKILSQSAKNGYLKIVQSRDPLGRQGVESLGRKKSVHPPPPRLPF